MKWFVLLDDSTGISRTLHRLDDKTADAAESALKEFVDDWAGKNSKQVFVLEVGADYQALVEAGRAEPIDGSQIFDSALKLSRHMGFKGNNVANALAKAEHQPPEWFKEQDLPRYAARVRGVVVRYMEHERDD